ncbi:hypothetical protein D3C72_1686890 [compost metagenome]
MRQAVHHLARDAGRLVQQAQQRVRRNAQQQAVLERFGAERVRFIEENHGFAEALAWTDQFQYLVGPFHGKHAQLDEAEDHHVGAFRHFALAEQHFAFFHFDTHDILAQLL